MYNFKSRHSSSECCVELTAFACVRERVNTHTQSVADGSSIAGDARFYTHTTTSNFAVVFNCNVRCAFCGADGTTTLRYGALIVGHVYLNDTLALLDQVGAVCCFMCCCALY